MIEEKKKKLSEKRHLERKNWKSSSTVTSSSRNNNPELKSCSTSVSVCPQLCVLRERRNEDANADDGGGREAVRTVSRLSVLKKKQTSY